MKSRICGFFVAAFVFIVILSTNSYAFNISGIDPSMNKSEVLEVMKALPEFSELIDKSEEKGVVTAFSKDGKPLVSAFFTKYGEVYGIKLVQDNVPESASETIYNDLFKRYGDPNYIELGYLNDYFHRNNDRDYRTCKINIKVPDGQHPGYKDFQLAEYKCQISMLSADNGEFIRELSIIAKQIKRQRGYIMPELFWSCSKGNSFRAVSRRFRKYRNSKTSTLSFFDDECKYKAQIIKGKLNIEFSNFGLANASLAKWRKNQEAQAEKKLEQNFKPRY